MKSSFYTYFHTRNDTSAVFYVGKGHGNRAHSVTFRNPHWQRIVAKCGHTVHIASKWDCEKDAFDHEKFLILCFKDIGVPLSNMTDGGEGSSGATHTEEFKLRMRKKMIGRAMSIETKAKMSASAKLRALTPEFIARNTGKNNPMKQPEIAERSGATQRGKKLTDDHKLKLSLAGMGRLGANKGKTASKETREKMSASAKGRVFTEEHKQRISASNKAFSAKKKEANK